MYFAYLLYLLCLLSVLCLVTLLYSLTPCSWVVFQKLTVSQPVKFPAFNGTRRFITDTCPYPESDQYIQCIHIPLPEDSSMLSTHLHLGLPDGLFPYCFPTRTLPSYVLHAPPVSFWLNTPIHRTSKCIHRRAQLYEVRIGRLVPGSRVPCCLHAMLCLGPNSEQALL